MRFIPLFEVGGVVCREPLSSTRPFKLSEDIKFENIPHPDESEEDATVDELLLVLVAEAATKPPPECPPRRRSVNSPKDWRKDLLRTVDDDVVEDADRGR